MCAYATSVAEYLAEHGEAFDLVVVFRLTAAERNLPTIRKHCPNAKLVFHTSDLHHLRELREANLLGSEELHTLAIQTRERELRLIRDMDATIVHSSVEKELLDEELDVPVAASKIFLFPWAIEIPGTEAPFGPRQGMIFVGGFQHQPNVDAAIFFATEIFPLVKEHLPEAVFYIVGSKAPEEVLKLAGDSIKVLGYVEDLGAIFDRCRLSVVPLRYGAGIKGKIGSSLSCGLPCVSTSIGAEGMGLIDSDGVLIEDDPIAFADAVRRLHQDAALWDECSRGGLDFVHRNYSLEAGVTTVKNLLELAGVPDSKISARDLSCMPGDSLTVNQVYVADQLDDPLETIRDIRSQAEYKEWVTSMSDVHRAERQRELDIANTYSHAPSYDLHGYCRICDKEVEFLIDQQSGARETDKGWIPNWRETTICPECKMNNRQRLMAAAARTVIRHHRDKKPDVYLMEQVTPIFKWMNESVWQANCVGSEYLGENIASGQIMKGLRHEDVERLSFADDSFDLIISNDVLEHVVSPKHALAEASRVLRPRGEFLLTVPFYRENAESSTRAELVNGEIKHVLPPVYHGNPVSDDGSLVFTDFGWDLLQDIRDVGFSDAKLHFCWSEVYGHLGPEIHYIHAVKT